MSDDQPVPGSALSRGNDLATVAETATMTSKRLGCALALFVLASAGSIACEPHSRGAKLFREKTCVQCHTINGKGGAVGPNLTSVGRRRSREYIIRQMNNPSSHNPNTAMPSFKNRLSEQEINDLADYLSDLK